MKSTKNTIFEIIGLSAVSIMLFICSLIAIKWMITFVTWSSLDSGWAQAIGTFLAIIGTWAATRHQLLQAKKVRETEQERFQLIMKQIAYELVHDAFRAVLSIALKFEKANNEGNHPKIGKERLEDVQESLRIFTAKELPPNLYGEILVVQREVAYTLTAVIQHQEGYPIDNRRVAKAMRRLRPILDCALRI